MPLRSRIRGWLAKDDQAVLEAAQAPPKTVQRTGIEYGIPDGGLTESNQGIGVATQTDRRTRHQCHLARYATHGTALPKL